MIAGSRRELLPDVPSLASTAVTVHSTVERIATNLSPDVALRSGRGKAIYVLRDRDHGKRPFYGSREGQDCLFRVSIESVHCNSVALDNVIAVQICHPSTRRPTPLRFCIVARSPQQWTLNAFLPAEVLESIALAVSEPSVGTSATEKRDFSFELCIHMTLPDVHHQVLVAS